MAFWATVVICVVSAPAAGTVAAAGPGLPAACELMTVTAAPAGAEDFGEAKKAADAAEWEAASKAFEARATELSKDAQKLFFDAQTQDPTEARAFLDRHARELGAIRIRGDSFTLALDLLTWGAYLSCRAGESEPGLRLLKIAWRDWGTERTKDDAALLLLAAGRADDAGQFVSADPKTDGQRIALAVRLCLTGRSADGARTLQDLAARLQDQKQKDALAAAAQQCLASPAEVR